MCRDRVRKTKAPVQLYLAEDMDNNHKGYYKYFGHKRHTRQNVVPLLKEAWEAVKRNMLKAEIFNTFFTFFFTINICLQESHTPETKEKV